MSPDPDSAGQQDRLTDSAQTCPSCGCGTEYATRLRCPLCGTALRDEGEVLGREVEAMALTEDELFARMSASALSGNEDFAAAEEWMRRVL